MISVSWWREKTSSLITRIFAAKAFQEARSGPRSDTELPMLSFWTRQADSKALKQQSCFSAGWTQLIQIASPRFATLVFRVPSHGCSSLARQRHVSESQW